MFKRNYENIDTPEYQRKGTYKKVQMNTKVCTICINRM